MIRASAYERYEAEMIRAAHAAEAIQSRRRDRSPIELDGEPRALGLVMEWATLHREELEENWQRARNLEPLESIPPLK